MNRMHRMKLYNPYIYLQSMLRTRGFGFITAWIHRICGVLLILYALIHINTLSTLTSPGEFSRKAQMFSGVLPMLLEWLLALPVIFHALNGGRLCVYELFSSRWDKLLLRWVFVASAGYMVLLGYLMLLGNQQVTPHFFWLCVLIAGLISCYLVIAKMRNNRSSPGWKMQRISGAFLFVLVPAHMLFMHLSPDTGRDVLVITERMAQPLIRIIDILLLSLVLYHGGYGLINIANDYIATKRARLIIVSLTALLLGLFWLQGSALIVTI